jgi:ketosteroid isomerase-like protein
MRFLVASALFAVSACGTPEPPTLDVAAQEASLLEADRAFNKATAEDRLEGWVRYFAENGAMFPQGRPVVRGHDAIRALMGPAFATEGFSLTWEPLEAEVSGAGDFGYTHGTFESRFPGEDGEVSITTGKYLTVWRKQTDGSWKVADDIGNNDPPTADDGENQ